MSKPVKKTILVDGMTCTNCALSVTKTMEKLGAKEVKTDFMSGEVSFSDKGEISFEAISSALDKVGFKAKEEIFKEETKGLTAIERKLLFSLVFSLPLFFHMFLPHDFFLNDPWVQLALCTPVFVLGFVHFGKSGWGSIRSGVANMDVLIFIGSSAAFAYSLWGTLLFYGSQEVHNYLFYETTSTIISLVLLGNVIEHRSVKQTTTAIKELSQLQEVKARRKKKVGDKIIFEEIPATDVRIGDILQVNSGDRIAVDGEVLEGNGSVNEAMITGESLPVTKEKGSSVVGGTILESGFLIMKATQVGKSTVLSRIIQLVKEAQGARPSIQRLGDKIAAIFVPVVVGIALCTFLISWLGFAIDFQESMMRAIAVLVISCPCAMGLATPTALAAGLGRAAKRGILIKGGDTLERLSAIEQMVFDKTGTLTTGKFKIAEFKVESGMDEQEIRSVVFKLESASSHPIARSLTDELKEAQPIDLKNKEEIKGKGMRGTDANGAVWEVGSDRLAPENVVSKGGILVLKNGKKVAEILITDELKKDAAETIRALKKLGISTIMLSGDKAENCKKVAEKIGIPNVFAERLPEEKLDLLKEWNLNQPVAMVGDGINDAPSLVAAHVGISMGNATEIAINSAQVVILGDRDLHRIVEARLIATATLKTIRQNLFWAFFYNVIAIPVAAIGLLNPMIAALSMAFSDVIVVGNSILLKYRKLS